MSGEEFVLSIIAIVMGCTVLIVGVTKITGLIKAWINRGGSEVDEESFNRLAKAFMQHKKDTERRLQNLETIASEQQDDSTGSSKQIEAPKQEIEIDERESEQEKSSSEGQNNLRNMLRE